MRRCGVWEGPRFANLVTLVLRMVCAIRSRFSRDSWQRDGCSSDTTPTRGLVRAQPPTTMTIDLLEGRILHTLELLNPTAELLTTNDDGTGDYQVTLNPQTHSLAFIPIAVPSAPTAADAKLEACRRFLAIIDPRPVEGGSQ